MTNFINKKKQLDILVNTDTKNTINILVYTQNVFKRFNFILIPHNKLSYKKRTNIIQFRELNYM